MGNLSRYTKHRSASHPRAHIPVIYKDSGANNPAVTTWNVAVRWADTGEFHVRCFYDFKPAARWAETACMMNQAFGAVAL